jgi:FkbM family methyltransferase
MSGLEALGASLGRLPLGPARALLRRLYHAALLLQTGGRGIRCSPPGGEIVRVLPEYRYLAWNPDEYAAFRDAARPGAVALDVGANVGAYSLLLGQWVGASGAVFAFEPAPAPFDGLVRHVRLNHLDGVVRPVREAVSDVTLATRLLVAGTAGESRLALAGDPIEHAVPVASTTIDEFCERTGIEPDFIKIDVEGFELSALRGARETIRRRARALALFVEMHPAVWPLIHVRQSDVLEELRAQSLEAVPLVPGITPWDTDGVCMRLTRKSPCGPPQQSTI